MRQGACGCPWGSQGVPAAAQACRVGFGLFGSSNYSGPAVPASDEPSIINAVRMICCRVDPQKMLEVLDGLTVLDPSLVPVGVVVPLPQQRPAAVAAEEPQAKRQKVADGERAGRGGAGGGAGPKRGRGRACVRHAAVGVVGLAGWRVGCEAAPGSGLLRCATGLQHGSWRRARAAAPCRLSLVGPRRGFLALATLPHPRVTVEPGLPLSPLQTRRRPCGGSWSRSGSCATATLCWCAGRVRGGVRGGVQRCVAVAVVRGQGWSGAAGPMVPGPSGRGRAHRPEVAAPLLVDGGGHVWCPVSHCCRSPRTRTSARCWRWWPTPRSRRTSRRRRRQRPSRRRRASRRWQPSSQRPRGQAASHRARYVMCPLCTSVRWTTLPGAEIRGARQLVCTHLRPGSMAAP